jgi:hypothetical protein
MNIKITPEKELFILNNLKISNKILAEKVGVNEVTIEKFLRKRGLKKGRRLINVDESFFEKIDSHQKAYVLGLIYADGWNNVSGNKWGIQLTEGDGYLLEKIASLIKYEGSIKTLKPSCKNGKPRKRLEICSKKMCSDLLLLGVQQKKSLILDFDEKIIPINFYPDFFRGVFDGDGTLYIGKSSQYEVKITSSIKFCQKSQSFFERNIMYKPSIYVYKKNISSADLRFKGKNNVIKFLNWIYLKKEDFFLKRKFEKFQLIH